jgi:hypothetical protein
MRYHFARNTRESFHTRLTAGESLHQTLSGFSTEALRGIVYGTKAKHEVETAWVLDLSSRRLSDIRQRRKTLLLPKLVLLLPCLNGLLMSALLTAHLSELVGQVVLFHRQVGQLRQRVAQRQRKRSSGSVLERQEGGREDFVVRLSQAGALGGGRHLGEKSVQKRRVFRSQLQGLQDVGGCKTVLDKTAKRKGSKGSGSHSVWQVDALNTYVWVSNFCFLKAAAKPSENL